MVKRKTATVEKTTRTPILGVRIDVALRRQLEALAEKDHRTLSSLVQKILAEYVDKSKR
jgi:predicted transcriptional regulator